MLIEHHRASSSIIEQLCSLALFFPLFFFPSRCRAYDAFSPVLLRKLEQLSSRIDARSNEGDERIPL